MLFVRICIAFVLGLAVFVQYRLQTLGIFPVPNVLPELAEFPTTIHNITGLVELIGENELVGPESMVQSSNKEYLFTALGDGRIARLQHSSDKNRTATWEFLPRTGSSTPKECVFTPSDVADTEVQCGRPLGIVVAKRSTVDPTFQQSEQNDEDVLLIADAYRGFLMMTNIYAADVKTVGITTLAVRAETDPPEYQFFLLNALVQTPDGSIYLTETSQHFQRRRVFWAVMEGQRTGRLLRYQPQTGVQVVAENLLLPNGIAQSHDGRYLIIVSGVQALRYSLERQEMSPDPFVNLLPGTGDNIDAMTHLPSGEPGKCYWAGLGSKFAKPFSLLKLVSDKPLLKSLLVALVPYKVLVDLIPKLSALAVYDEAGKLIKIYRDESNAFPWVSEGESFDGYLYLGSWYNPCVARVKEGDMAIPGSDATS